MGDATHAVNLDPPWLTRCGMVWSPSLRPDGDHKDRAIVHQSSITDYAPPTCGHCKRIAHVDLAKVNEQLSLLRLRWTAGDNRASARVQEGSLSLWPLLNARIDVHLFRGVWWHPDTRSTNAGPWRTWVEAALAAEAAAVTACIQILGNLTGG
jgi:hypothetical protein